MNNIIYQECDIIGNGAFCSVYKGYHNKLNKNVAIKISDKEFLNEINIYNILSNEMKIIKKLDNFYNNNKFYLIIDLLDKSCYAINKNINFTKKDILMISIQLIQQLFILHNNGILHMDIKPENIMYDSDNNKFKLIDFNLSKKYIINNKHILFNKNISRRGTLKFISLNIHNKYESSRRDDFISLIYTLIYLENKKYIFWNNINDINLIKKKKIFLNKNIDDFNISIELKFLYKYIMNLKFNQKPQYDFLIKVIYNYLHINNYKYDGKWSWREKENL